MGAQLSHLLRLPEQTILSNLASSVRDISSSTPFPCKNPYIPNMLNTETRIASFDHRWKREKMLVQPKELAVAGFCFLGSCDRTKCFYCGGGLHNWEMTDDPWYEHAKWYPTCEYLLRKKVWNL